MMKARIRKKLTNIACRIYDLDIREGLGGMGGCECLNSREQRKLDNLRRFYHNHPRYREYCLYQERRFNAALAALPAQALHSLFND